MDDQIIETEDPIHKVSGGYEWGERGRVYPTRAGAARQAAAAYAKGYTGDDDADGDGEPPHAAGLMLQAPSGKVLFLKRHPNAAYGDTWCFPGGSCEPEKDGEDAAIRETREETGYQHEGELGESLTVHVGFATHYADCEDEFEPRLNEEHTDHVWAHPHEAPTPLHPGVAHTLENIDWHDVPEEGEESEDDEIFEEDCEDSFEEQADPAIEAELLKTEECADSVGSWFDQGVHSVLRYFDAKQATEAATHAEQAKVRRAVKTLTTLLGNQTTTRSKTGATRPAKAPAPKSVKKAPAKAAPRQAKGVEKATPKRSPGGAQGGSYGEAEGTTEAQAGTCDEGACKAAGGC